MEAQCPEKAQAMANWEKEVHNRINLKEEVKVSIKGRSHISKEGSYAYLPS